MSGSFLIFAGKTLSDPWTLEAEELTFSHEASVPTLHLTKLNMDFYFELTLWVYRALINGATVTPIHPFYFQLLKYLCTGIKTHLLSIGVSGAPQLWALFCWFVDKDVKSQWKLTASLRNSVQTESESCSSCLRWSICNIPQYKWKYEINKILFCRFYTSHYLTSYTRAE